MKRRIIISALVVIIVGGAFYLLWPQPDTGKGLLWSYFDTNQSEPKDSLDTPTTSPSNPISEIDTLSIPAWNVKFSIPSSLQDTIVKYVERKSNDEPSVTYYAFTTSRIQALGNKCQTQPFGDIVILNRYTEKPVAVPDGELINEKPIAGYYYIVSSPIASCSAFDTSDNMRSPSSIEIRDRESIKELVKSVQAS